MCIGYTVPKLESCEVARELKLNGFEARLSAKLESHLQEVWTFVL